MSLSCYVLQNKYKEKYANHMKGHYEGTGLDKKTLHAMKVRKLASDVRPQYCYYTANIMSWSCAAIAECHLTHLIPV